MYCDKHVAAVPENRTGPDFSASGARPPMYAHPGCGHGRRQPTGLRAARRDLRAGR
ncbi:hypothetical protein [Streptomyces sp. NPDC059949]|uniref:hypothetical protein n=1 Tax=Streptomyces sp. NPDC059949 TaxID=3347013 RepID=UPI00364ED6F9